MSRRKERRGHYKAVKDRRHLRHVDAGPDERRKRNGRDRRRTSRTSHGGEA